MRRDENRIQTMDVLRFKQDCIISDVVQEDGTTLLEFITTILQDIAMDDLAYVTIGKSRDKSSILVTATTAKGNKIYAGGKTLAELARQLDIAGLTEPTSGDSLDGSTMPF